MNREFNNLVLFLGHLHPALVHLPIGAFAVLAFSELVATFARFKNAAANSRTILGFATAAALVAALTGWLLSQSGYDAQLLRWHKWAGLAVAGGSVVCLILRRLDWALSYRVALGVTVLLVLLAGHLGGEITHGRDFFLRPLRLLLGMEGPSMSAPRPTLHLTPADPMDRLVFEDVIQPLLRQRCSRCHGAEKHKSGLRVDSYDALLKGGKDGPALVPGHASASHVIERMRQPLDGDDHMPPKGQPQPTPEELVLLEWWINAGAPAHATIRDLKPEAEILQLLSAQTKAK